MVYGSLDMKQHLLDLMDYPSVLQHPVEAAAGLYRLTADGRSFRYEEGDAPPDLDIGPTTLILKSERARLVHDWTCAGVNQVLEAPPTKFDTMGKPPIRPSEPLTLQALKS